jgi:hypothetical protein
MIGGMDSTDVPMIDADTAEAFGAVWDVNVTQFLPGALSPPTRPFGPVRLFHVQGLLHMAGGGPGYVDDCGLEQPPPIVRTMYAARLEFSDGPGCAAILASGFEYDDTGRLVACRWEIEPFRWADDSDE